MDWQKFVAALSQYELELLRDAMRNRLPYMVPLQPSDARYELDDAEKTLARKGYRINAIRHYRDRTQGNLVMARDAVNKYMLGREV